MASPAALLGVQALLDVSVVNGFLSTLALAAGSNRALEIVDTAVCQVRGPVPLYCTHILPLVLRDPPGICSSTAGVNLLKGCLGLMARVIGAAGGGHHP